MDENETMEQFRYIHGADIGHEVVAHDYTFFDGSVVTVALCSCRQHVMIAKEPSP